jgi:hypothetical protein
MNVRALKVGGWLCAAVLGLAVAAAPSAAGAAGRPALGVPAKGKPKPKPKVVPKGDDAAPATAAAAPGPGSGAPKSDAPSGDDSGIIETKGGTAHVDFSEATIEGVGTKAGAVYLYERSDSDLLSIVRLRTSYRDELIRTVFSPGDVEVKKKAGAAKTPAPAAAPAPGDKTPAKPIPLPLKGKTGK